MHQYESLLEESFGLEKYYKRIRNIPPLEMARRRAVRFLEMNCSAVWGFPNEARVIYDNNIPPVTNIPVAFESALFLPLLKDAGVDPLMTYCLTVHVKRRRERNGFWNPFIREPEFTEDFFPDDIDDTSVCAMSLYLNGELSENECISLGNKLIDSVQFADNGAFTVWMYQKDPQRVTIYDNYFNKPKICGGCIANCLWFLSTFGMDTRDEVKPTLEFLDRFIDLLIQSKDPDEEIEGMMYYTNKYPIYFFLARYIATSEYGQKRYFHRFASLILEQLKSFPEREQSTINPLDTACVILAVTTLKLHLVESPVYWTNEDHSMETIKGRVGKLVDALIGMQGEDGSYPPCVFYRWNRIGHYAASKVLTTGFVLAALVAAENDV